MPWFITVHCLGEKMCKWPDSSVSRATVWYFEGLGLKFRSGCILFMLIGAKCVALTAYSSEFNSHSSVLPLEIWGLMCKLLNSSVGGAAVRYSECPRFESWSACTFFSPCYKITNNGRTLKSLVIIQIGLKLWTFYMHETFLILLHIKIQID
jgi:hypothetical protein